jgi:hypothetical protein
MRRRSSVDELAFLSKPPVLISESADEFDALQSTLEQEIKPRDPIEHIYVNDFISIIWEILRLRRCKVGIVNIARKSALGTLLARLLSADCCLDFARTDAGALAKGWFTDPKAQEEIIELLGQFQLDESAIEAEAVRSSSADLEQLDRMLASLESRRNKALRCIGEYRDGLARQLRERSDRIIDGKDVPRLEHVSGKRSSAA